MGALFPLAGVIPGARQAARMNAKLDAARRAVGEVRADQAVMNRPPLLGPADVIPVDRGLDPVPDERGGVRSAPGTTPAITEQMMRDALARMDAPDIQVPEGRASIARVPTPEAVVPPLIGQTSEPSVIPARKGIRPVEPSPAIVPEDKVQGGTVGQGERSLTAYQGKLREDALAVKKAEEDAQVARDKAQAEINRITDENKRVLNEEDR
jgi:hypothetical protein